MPKTYEPISTQTLPSNTATVTFSSIPQTYTDLILVHAYDLASGAGSMYMRFNSDSGTNYNFTYIFGNGSAAGAGRGANQTGVVAGRAAIGGQGGGYTHIFNYTNSTIYKTVLSRSFGLIASASPWFSTNMWRNTNAITSITCTDESGGNFAAGGVFTLYGIKAA
jgi:hypothetical protein